jgi:protein-disulfide isomerase
MKLRLSLVLSLLLPSLAWAAPPADFRNEVARFAADYLPWEPQTKVTASRYAEGDLRGFEAYMVLRKGKYSKLDAKQAFLVSADHKWVFTGSVVKNSQGAAHTAPIQTDGDIVGVADYFHTLFRAPARAYLDPSGDRAGVKGVRIELDTGYFNQKVYVYVEPDGSALMIGQIWKIDESVPAQRRAIIDLADTPSQGVADPALHVVEYADMECPFCKRRGEEMDKLMDKYAARLKMRRYYKYFPLWANHVWSTKAASAAVCLSRVNPDYVFKFKALCYQNQATLTLDQLDQLAFDFVDSAGISRKDFVSCYLQPASFKPIERDMVEGSRLGVNSTPSYFINGIEIYWLPDEVMEDFLKEQLAGKK